MGSEHILTKYMLAPGENTIPEYVMLCDAIDAPTSAFDISRNSTTSHLSRPTSTWLGEFSRYVTLELFDVHL